MERAAASNASCRLRQVTTDNFDWTRIAGRTVSGRLTDRRLDTYRYPVTGPESALQGRYYIYIEASGQFRDSVARLTHFTASHWLLYLLTCLLTRGLFFPPLLCVVEIVNDVDE